MPFPIPQDNSGYRFPVSVKCVIFSNDRFVLLKNERDEWELPGGKLELGETPEECLRREIIEELRLDIKIGALLDTWVYHIYEDVDVLILTYGCYTESLEKATCSSEHKAIGFFKPEEIDNLRMPEGYKKSIKSWLNVM